MRPLALMIGLMGAAILPYECGAQIFDSPFSEYLERGVTIAPSGGNAKDANAAIHTINPWPPYVRQTRIPDDGRRAVNSMERMYRIPDPFPAQQGVGSGATGLGAAPGANAGMGLGAGATMGPGVGTSGY